MANLSEELQDAQAAGAALAETLRPGLAALTETSQHKRRKTAHISIVHTVFDAPGTNGRIKCWLLPETKPNAGGNPHGSFKPDPTGTTKQLRHLNRWHKSWFAKATVAFAEGRIDKV